MKGIFLYDGKVKRGPFSPEEIRNMTIAQETKFWYEGLPQWLPVDKLPEVKIEKNITDDNKSGINSGKIRLLWGITIIVLISVLAIYSIFFNEFSETELVELSFYWFGPLVFCITSLIACYGRSKHPILYGLIGALTATLALVLFFAGLWSAL